MDYDDMLERAVDQTPDNKDQDKRFDVVDVDVRQEGNVTVFENFQQVVDDLGREDSHLMGFLQNDLGTSGQIDESGRARLTGDFRQPRIGDAIDEYATKFVICSECGLPDTRIEMDGETAMLRCEACGERSSAGK